METQFFEDPILSFTNIKTQRFALQKLKVWIYPSFEPCQVWSVYSLRDSYYTKKALFVRNIEIGNHYYNTNPLEDKTEKICIKDGLIDESIYSNFRSNIESVQINGIPQRRAVIDGIRYGIEYDDCNLSWHYPAPEQFRNLEILFDEIVEFFKTSIENSPLNIKDLELN